jgi:FAD/FMN-containing dehydrogenase
VADDDAGMARLWRWREAHSEAAAALGLVHKADVTVPLGSMATFVDDLGPRIEEVAPGATTFVFGHLGDGNLHVGVVGPAAEDERAVGAVLELALARGGSVSAEHGIGVAKRGWLERQRGPEAVVAMRAIKAALDPDGILNPGVLLP